MRGCPRHACGCWRRRCGSPSPPAASDPGGAGDGRFRSYGDRGDSPEPDGLPARYALVVSRLAAEKGIDVAIGACRRAGMPLVIAGEGPERGRLEALAQGAEVRLLGAVGDERLAGLRAGAAVALAPSRSAETFGVAPAEAMAAGVPVVGSRIGALPEILAEDELVEPGDERALAQAILRVAGDRAAGERGRARIEAVCGPEVVADGLRAAYEQAREHAAVRGRPRVPGR